MSNSRIFGQWPDWSRICGRWMGSQIGNDILSSWLATNIGIYTSQDENQDGHDGSYIECYMKEHPGTPIENARCHVMHTISETWKLLNQQCLAPNPFSTCFTKACLNVARMVPLMYSYDDNQCLPSLEEHMKSLVKASVSSQSIPPSRITLLKVHLWKIVLLTFLDGVTSHWRIVSCLKISNKMVKVSVAFEIWK